MFFKAYMAIQDLRVITYFFGSYLPQSSFWPANEPSNSVDPNSANPSQRPEANLGLVMERSEHNEMRSFYEEILHCFFQNYRFKYIKKL